MIRLLVVTCAMLASELVPTLALGSKSGVKPLRLSLPEGPGSIQGLGEDPEPNLTMGLAGYDVPIALPAGYAGLTPQLRLSYSSGGGASVVGMGWSLGLPYVERMTRYGLPRYASDDPIASASAGELVRADSSGVYRTREEGGFVRFTWVDDATDHWVAEYPDGRRAYFGATELGVRDDASRISANGAGEDGAQSGTFRWCLTAEIAWDT